MAPHLLTPDNPQNGDVSQEKKSPFWGARSFRFDANIPGMGNNLKELRKAAGLTQPQAAAALGMSKGGYVKIEDGERRLTIDLIRRAAPVFGVRETDFVQDGMRQVPLVGYVGAGAEAFFGNGQGPFEPVDAPDDATEKTVAVEIRGTSLGELFDRWLVYYDDRRDPVTSDLAGKLCVVGLADERVLVKKLKPGRLPKHWDLLSNTEPPIYDAEVLWAARVKQMTPR